MKDKSISWSFCELCVLLSKFATKKNYNRGSLEITDFFSLTIRLWRSFTFGINYHCNTNFQNFIIQRKIWNKISNLIHSMFLSFVQTTTETFKCFIAPKAFNVSWLNVPLKKKNLVLFSERTHDHLLISPFLELHHLMKFISHFSLFQRQLD